MQINKDKLIKKVAEEHQIAQKQADTIIKSVFSFTRDVIKEDDPKAIRLIHFGIFVHKNEINYNINKTK